MAYSGKRPSFNGVVYTPLAAIPSNPTEGQVYYSDGTAAAEGLYLYRNSAWESVEGGGAGGINYIENSDAESATTGYVTYDDGASSVPVDGTAGTAANLTFSRNTSSPLRGVADFDLAKAAADAQGEGVSYAFTIDNADQASIIRVSFDYTVSANYADADMGVYIYDVTNATLIRMSKEDIDATSLKGHFVSEFQSSSNSTSYRLIFHVQSTNATAYDFNFDNVQVGPRSITRGPVVTDWIDYTPTFAGFGTATNVNVEYRRVGGSIEVRGGFAAGTPTAVPARIGLPAGLTMAGESRFYCGEIVRNATAQPYRLFGVNGRTDGFSIGAGGSQHGDVSGDTFVGASEQLYFEGTCPIQGWSSNSTISEDFGGREITVRGAGNAGEAVTNLATNIPFTETEDSTGSWNGSVFTVPETGNYMISGNVQVTPAQIFDVYFYVNNTNTRHVASSHNTSIDREFFSGSIYLTAGDQISVRLGILAACNLVNSTLAHSIHIQKIATPQTLLGGEIVSFSAISTETTSLTNGGTTVLGSSSTSVEWDTHNAFSAGSYTVPRSGFYEAKASITLSGYTGARIVNIFFRVNGTTIKTCSATQQDGSFAIVGPVSGAVDLNVVKGDVITIVIQQQNTTVATATLTGGNTDAQVNGQFIQIKKVN